MRIRLTIEIEIGKSGSLEKKTTVTSLLKKCKLKTAGYDRNMRVSNLVLIKNPPK
jgi:hypothetical protein